MKICTQCDIAKPLSEFHKRSDSKDGFKSNCKDCRNLDSRIYGQTNKDKIRMKKQVYYKFNKAEFSRRTLKWIESNRERRNEIQSKYYSRNRARYKAWHNEYLMRLQQALPQWANLEDIETIYENCPKGFEVDHIVPIKGKNVCGLHVEHNLQYLTASENRRKINKFEV